MRIALTAPILLAALAFDAGADSASDVPSGDVQQVDAAVAAWRLRFDPLYAYRAAHCNGAALLRHELADFVLRLADRSRATACERLTAHTETIRASVHDGRAVEEVADYDARPGERLRFALQRDGSNWTISAVSADANDGTPLTLYDRAGEGASNGTDPRTTDTSTTAANAPAATLAPAALSRWMPDGSAPWQVMHVITYGQSLSQGFSRAPCCRRVNAMHRCASPAACVPTTV